MLAHIMCSFLPLRCRVSVSHVKKHSCSNERAMTAGLTKMLRRFSTADAQANKANRMMAE